jgi:hypothetical protein
MFADIQTVITDAVEARPLRAGLIAVARTDGRAARIALFDIRRDRIDRACVRMRRENDIATGQRGDQAAEWQA